MEKRRVKMNKYYFTFGCAMPYRKTFVLMHARSPEMARTMMFAAHGPKWSMMYDEEQFDGMAKKYGYTMMAEFREDAPNIDWSI